MLRSVSVLFFAGVLLAATPSLAQQAPDATPAPAAPAAPATPPAPTAPAAPVAPVTPPAPNAPAVGAPDASGAPGAPGAAQVPAAGAIPGNQFCSKDLTPMLVNRGKIAQSLQAINKRPKPKTFETFKRNFNDFCGQLSAYIANDQKIVEYMNKNKDFCALDDTAIASQVKDAANAQATRKKICSHPPREPTAPPPGAAGAGRAPLPKPPVNLRLQ
jgi:hypothetical protein